MHIHPSVFLECEQLSEQQKVAEKKETHNSSFVANAKCKCVSACAKEIAQETDVLIQNDSDDDEKEEVSELKIK